MPLSPKEAVERWKAAVGPAAANYSLGVDAALAADEAYIAERMTLEEFEAEVGRLLEELS